MSPREAGAACAQDAIADGIPASMVRGLADDRETAVEFAAGYLSAGEIEPSPEEVAEFMSGAAEWIGRAPEFLSAYLDEEAQS